MVHLRRSRGKAEGDHGINWVEKNSPGLGLIELLEILRDQGARLGLKINVKRTKSRRLGISEIEKLTSDNEKIYQVGSFTYISSIISKHGGSSEDIKIH